MEGSLGKKEAAKINDSQSGFSNLGMADEGSAFKILSNHVWVDKILRQLWFSMDSAVEASIDQADILYKLIVIGDMSVGKSQLWSRWLKDEFDLESRSTVGVEFGAKHFRVGNELIVGIQLWDTAGQERYRAITKQYYRGAHGVLVVFDLTARETFKSIPSWLKDVLVIKSASVSDNLQLILVGNKADLYKLREVTFDEAKKFAQTNSMEYVEVSALTGDRCPETLQHLLQAIHATEGPKLLEQLKDSNVRDSLKSKRRRIDVFNPDGGNAPPPPEEDYCSC